MICKKCGEVMEGDGYSFALHCPNAKESDWDSNEPDAKPVECDGESND